MSALIIAEVGVNHNGSIDQAKKLVDVAKLAGADIVKFQTFKSERLVTVDAQKAQYQRENIEGGSTQFDMLKALELSKAEFIELKRYCDNCNIEFLSTAFDTESLSFLVNEVGLKRLKIPSGELTNIPFVMQHAQTNLPLIVSTGMADLDDVNRAVLSISLANEYHSDYPWLAGVLEKNKQLDYSALAKRVTLLHCTTEYPAPVETINLNAMVTVWNQFDLPIGYSDHSTGDLAAVGAIALGATVIEKHITLSKTLPGPDHKASMEPKEFENFVHSVRTMELMLGTGEKSPADIEKQNRIAARKSIVSAQPIAKGDTFTQENLTFKRPGNGLPPFEIFRLVGQVADQDYKADETIK